MVRRCRGRNSYRTDPSLLQYASIDCLQSLQSSHALLPLHIIIPGTLHAVSVSWMQHRPNHLKRNGDENRNFTGKTTASMMLYSRVFLFGRVCVAKYQGKRAYPEKQHRHQQTGGNAERRLATLCAGLEAGLSGAPKDILWRWAFFILARGVSRAAS